MKKCIYLLFTILGLVSCGQPKEWQEIKLISLGDITPIGLTDLHGQIWIADGDNNRVVSISEKGAINLSFGDFDRPMHLSSDENSLYIPAYGADSIFQINEYGRNAIAIPDSLDAPAGVDVMGKEILIADFYNHRILYFDGITWNSFGHKGKAKGEFHYPTDVQLSTTKIYVADAYNNRIQVFDKKGNHLQTIGEEEKMNAATGLFVTENEIFVTDFENDRVLIYNLEGRLIQTITNNMDKPTDVLVIKQQLYVANYKGKNLVVFQ